MDEGKLLQDALGIVKAQSVLMKRSLDVDQIMDALKSASTMLAELRTSSLGPKQYYELYMSVFDALRHLTTYLHDAHSTGKHHLADLYELVQYAGNIVPRLYLMITVGSVYMSIPDAPVKEIMKDMLEMTRGVQHATRGLFLRHYLSGQTRDYLPLGQSDGLDGNLQDSIAFVLTNFVEMNKLWVRLQHHGPSKEREKRENERKDLRILVGTNLVRLSQLDGVDLEMYRQAILPSILEQVVGCKDVIAQEYLMEVVIQVFTDELHLHTLDTFLSATAQLHPKVNVKQIVIALIDRLAAFAARESESESPEERKRGEEAAAERLAQRIKSVRQGNPASLDYNTGYIASETISTSQGADVNTVEKPPIRGLEEQSAIAIGAAYPASTFRGIPAQVRLFEIFWQQVVQLISLRPDLALHDITALLVSLLNLALSCYPDRLEYVDHLLVYVDKKLEEYAADPESMAPQTTTNLLCLLSAPVTGYTSALTLLAIPSYPKLLKKQPVATRVAIGQAIVSSVLKNATKIQTPYDVEGILELCQVLVTGPTVTTSRSGGRSCDSDAIAEEQGWLARMIHLCVSDNAETNFQLLQTARAHFCQGGLRIKYTYPSLITATVRLARLDDSRDIEDHQTTIISNMFKFVHQMIIGLYTSVDIPEICLRLCLLAAEAAGLRRLEELAYEFYVQAFVIYEESISDSRAQSDAITAIILALQRSHVFGQENYDTLVTKSALHGSKLLKKNHQAITVLMASHMWWQGDLSETPRTLKGAPLRDGKRVLECLQKALRIASSCIDEMLSIELYVSALDRYLYYFEQNNKVVTVKHINSLLELITSNIGALEPSRYSYRAVQGDADQSRAAITAHFLNVINYIDSKQRSQDQDTQAGLPDNEVPWKEIATEHIVQLRLNRQ